MMTTTDVVHVLDSLDAADVRAWVEGGWGVDALVGHQTCPHDDVDLAIDSANGGFDRAMAGLLAIGFVVTLDDLPVRLVVEAIDGRCVDLHPLRFAADGSGLQSGHERDYPYPAAGFTVGRIADRDVPCLTAALQIDFHSHYEPRDVDHHDLAQLAALVEDLPAAHIRTFEVRDQAEVIALWRACDLTRPWNDPARDIERKVAVADDLFLVGTIHGVVVAAVMAGYEGHRGWVNYLAVDPAHQGSGFGRALMAEVEVRLRTLGCPKINLQVRTSNPAAIAFYQRLGFAVDDAVSLGKRLESDEPR